jgi:hypothetical protein
MALLTLEAYSDNTLVIDQIGQINSFIQTWTGQNIEIEIVNTTSNIDGVFSIDGITTLGKPVNEEQITKGKFFNLSFKITKDTFTYSASSLLESDKLIVNTLKFDKLILDRATNKLTVYLPKIEVVDDPYNEPKPRLVDSPTKWIFKPI